MASIGDEPSYLRRLLARYDEVLQQAQEAGVRRHIEDLAVEARRRLQALEAGPLASHTRFAAHVDVPLSSDDAGSQLRQMCDWCGEQVGRGRWNMRHGATATAGHVRFYFVEPEAAQRFAARWLPSNV